MTQHANNYYTRRFFPNGFGVAICCNSMTYGPHNSNGGEFVLILLRGTEDAFYVDHAAYAHDGGLVGNDRVGMGCVEPCDLGTSMRRVEALPANIKPEEF